MKVLIIIPARKGSKGVKNKNFLKIDKHTLLEHSCIFSKKLIFAKKIIVSSDSTIAKKQQKNLIYFFQKDQKNLHQIIH